jgi:Ca-activated chloride channel family protein
MKFADPIWLLAGAAVLVLLFGLYRRFDARQRAALAEFASSHLLAQLTASFSPERRRLKRVLFAAAVACIFIALARPQLGYHWEEQKQRGIDILFALDTSKSMLTQDVMPDRLTRAKLAITDLVRKLDGDRVGLIAFAGDAFLQAPLTLDYNAFEESLDAIDTSTIPRGGTDISSAIQEAQVALSNTKNRKILVLLTDGEDLEAKGIDAARAAAADGLKIYTIGVGSAAGGLIPLPNASGGTDFVKDASGQFVKSHLDENTLRQIAQVTGGLYEPLGQQGQGLQTLYNTALASLPKQELASRSQRVYDERFQWPLAAGIVLLLAGMMIGTRRRNAATRKSPAAPSKTFRTARATTGALALIGLISWAHASPQSAEHAYQQGDYSSAEKQYENAVEQRPDAAPLQFNLGAAAYKSGQYDTALPAFQKALGTDQVGVQQQAYYDMGNTQYRIGQKTEKATPQDTIKNWQAAVQSYDAALKLRPDDGDAKYNRDFVQKKLDELQKQQKQNQKDQQKQDQQNQQQNQDQQNQRQQQNGGSPNQQQQQKSGGQNQQNQQNNQAGQQGSQGQQNQNQAQNNQANQPNQNQSGSQNQAQNGKPDQQNQNQNGPSGQPKDQQSGQQQTAGNQGNPSPASGQGQQQQGGTDNQKAQLGQDGMKQAGPRGQTIPDKNPPQQQPGEQVAAADKPGEMSAQEAKDLLNSMRNGEHVLPATADARNAANHSPDEQTLKDW